MDVIVVVAVLAFFAVGAAYVAFCERAVGSDDRHPGGPGRTGGS